MLSKSPVILFFFITLQTIAYSQPLQQTYQLDAKKSRILWNTGKLMGGHNGYLLFNSGSLQYSAAGAPVSGTFSMDMNSMRATDNPQDENNKRTSDNLRKTDFFAADQYPISTITVKKITRIGTTTTYNVAGDLTIKGITNPVEFTATILTKDNNANITADVHILRKLWNIDSKPEQNKPLDFLSAATEKLTPDIHVTLDLTLKK
jgi:polyisoprenoid-binding protein YceI